VLHASVFPPSRNSTPTCELRHSVELNAVVLIAVAVRRETHHDLLLRNGAAPSFFPEYSARCK
jgi:hypothetical protein